MRLGAGENNRSQSMVGESELTDGTALTHAGEERLGSQPVPAPLLQACVYEEEKMRFKLSWICFLAILLGCQICILFIERQW